MNTESSGRARFEKKTALIVVLLVLISLPISAYGSDRGIDSRPEKLQVSESKIEYVECEPIRVEGDDGFDEEYWIGNGTEEDPYELKENYSIDASGYEYGIKVENVTHHIIIKNTQIYGASGNTGAGIHLRTLDFAKIIENDIYNNDVGIYAYSDFLGGTNLFERNQVTNNERGFFFERTYNDLVKDNVITNNTGSGYYSYHASEMKVIDNTISNNSFEGVELDHYSNTHLIEGNTIFENGEVGIHIHSVSGDNQITENEIENNDDGVKIEGSRDNEIWKNKFIDNTVQAHDDHENEWDLGDPAEGGEGGNYWSDYSGQDRHDNIGDVPYDVDGSDNHDSYPWMTKEMVRHPVDRFDLSVENITAGDSPVIELSETYNVENHPLKGKYEFKIAGGEKTHMSALNFDSGETTYTEEEINITGKYTRNVTADGVTESDTFYVEPAEAHTVTIFPSEETSQTAGESLEFIAEAFDEYGNLISDDDKSFSWENASDGNFNETKTGEYKVRAIFKGEKDILSKPTNITVKAADVHSVELDTQTETNITAGETLEFTAKAHDQYNNLVTDEAKDFNWENTTNGIFDVTTAGEYEITASYKENKTFTTEPFNLTVEPADVQHVELQNSSKKNITAGEEIQLTANSYDIYNNLVTNDPKEFNWENASNGIFNDTTEGVYKITAVFEGEEDIVSEPSNITVKPAAVHSVELLTLSKTNITAGETIEFKAEAYDRYENMITNYSEDFKWKNAPNGTFNETKTGEYEVEAVYESEDDPTSKPITVTIKAGKAYSVEIQEPPKMNITAGGTLKFDAEVYDKYYNLVAADEENFNWDWVSNGTFNETDPGEYEVRAAYHDDGVKVTSEPSIVRVKPAELHDFDLLVEDINAGHGPDIKITDMRDEHDNPLGGRYEVEISIADNTKTANLTFSEGSSVYDWNQITLAKRYSVEINIQGINRSERFRVNPGSPDSIEIRASEETVVSGESVIYTSIASDKWGNQIEKVTEETHWMIEEGARGEWRDNEYESENQGTWNVTGSYLYDGQNMTDVYTLTVTAEIETFEYLGFDTIIFEENLDYKLEWYVGENNAIYSYELLAGNSPEELETIKMGLKNESYRYQFEDGNTTHFKIIGYNGENEKVESIDFEVTVDLIKLEVEEREEKIFSIVIPEDRREGVNVTWSIDGEVRENGTVFIPDLGPGKYNLTAEISDEDHVEEKTLEFLIEGSESEDDRIIILIIVGALLIILTSVIIYKKLNKDPEEKNVFDFSWIQSSENISVKDNSMIEKKQRSIKSENNKKSSSPGDVKATSIEGSILNQGNDPGEVDKELVVRIFEDIKKATKKHAYAELTGKTNDVIDVQKLEEKIKSLVKEERLTMQPRRDADTLYIWNGE